MLLDDAVVGLVTANPLPVDRVSPQRPQHTIMSPHIGRIQITPGSWHMLQVQAPMPRVRFEKRVGGFGLVLDVLRQGVEQLLEVPGTPRTKHQRVQPPSSTSPLAMA